MRSTMRSLEGSLDNSSKEKEEMALHLTDALLEMEAKKSTWLTKEKAFIEANERVKISNNEICRLSEDLLEARRELESCREQCRSLEERLILFSENAEREKSFKMDILSAATYASQECTTKLKAR